MDRIARWVVRHRKWVLAAWLAAAAALIPRASRIADELEVAARVNGSEATSVERDLATRVHSPFARWALLVVSGTPSPVSAEGHALLDSIIAVVNDVAGVQGTLSYLDARDTMFIGHGGSGTFVIVGLDPSNPRPDAMVPPLREATEQFAARLRPALPNLALRWTGEVPLNFDLRRTSSTDSRRAELRVLPLTLGMLVLAFGALVAALLPVAAATLAIAISLGVAVLIDGVWPLSIMLQNIVTMIGLGVGIDYALLTVSRFRESLAAGRSPEDAAIEAAHHAGGTIALSGAAVMIGFAALLLVPLSELQAIGTGGMIVVSVSVLLAVTLLPGILAWLGTRVDAGRLFRASSRPQGDRWRWWGRWVVAHPWLILFAAGTPVLLLAWEARRLNPELPRGSWLPSAMESSVAIDDLGTMHRSGITNTLRLLIDLPPGAPVLTEGGWATIREVTDSVRADPRVARVQSITTVLPMTHPSELAFSMAPARARNALVSADGLTAVVEIVPHDSVAFSSLVLLARELRRATPRIAVNGHNATVRVGGLAAFNADYSDAIDSRVVSVVGTVVGLTLLALMVGFRSVLIPVKALALNLLSVAAAFGAVVLVFQDGHGGAMFGIDAPLGGVFPAIPILVFCIVFGLSMDYEVFLVSRVAEARRTLGESAAIVEGLARTGGVITSAAAIMIVVFAAFTMNDFIFIKILGFALAIAVLLDATIVRMAIGPALLQLAGRWNWWPGKQSALPRTSWQGAPSTSETRT